MRRARLTVRRYEGVVQRDGFAVRVEHLLDAMEMREVVATQLWDEVTDGGSTPDAPLSRKRLDDAVRDYLRGHGGDLMDLWENWGGEDDDADAARDWATDQLTRLYPGIKVEW